MDVPMSCFYFYWAPSWFLSWTLWCPLLPIFMQRSSGTVYSIPDVVMMVLPVLSVQAGKAVHGMKPIICSLCAATHQWRDDLNVKFKRSFFLCRGLSEFHFISSVCSLVWTFRYNVVEIKIILIRKQFSSLYLTAERGEPQQGHVFFLLKELI